MDLTQYNAATAATSRRTAALTDLIGGALTGGATSETLARWQSGPENLETPVLGDVPHEARIMKEELFGPVAIVSNFQFLDKVFERANILPYSLSGFVSHASMRRSAAAKTGVWERLSA